MVGPEGTASSAATTGPIHSSMRITEVLNATEAALKQLDTLADNLRQVGTDDPYRYRQGTEFMELTQCVWGAHSDLTSAVSNLLRGVAVLQRAVPFGVRELPAAIREGGSASSACVHSCEGSILTTCIVRSSSSTTRVDLKPDHQLEGLHPDVRQALGNSLVQARPGGQALLLPLFVTDQCSVAVERPVATAQPALSIGFTVAAVVGLASKLMWAMDKKSALKGVIVTRHAKAEQVEALLSALPRTIQQVNLLNPSCPPPAQVLENHPRIVACTAQDIIERSMIRTDDIDHLIIDDCDEATVKIFAHESFKRLRDVIFRGPLNVLHKLPTPSSTRYRARLWTVERTVNIFDVQAFTMARQIEELFASFPPGRNYLHTTQANVFLQNATVIASLDLLPEDVDHLVIADIPFTVSDVSAMLRKAAARVVLIVCSQPSAKPMLVDALAHEGLAPARVQPTSCSISRVVEYPGASHLTARY